MYLQMLPGACVALLDALSMKCGERLEAALVLFEQERSAFLNWIELHGALPAQPQEQASFENLRLLWLELEQTLRSPNLSEVLDKVYAVYGLRAEIQRDRWRRGFCTEEVVNGALLAAEQVICQCLPPTLLKSWSQALENYFRGCWERALECGCFPLEDRGFRAFQRGLELWAVGPGGAELEECLRWLAWGSNQIESLLQGLKPGFLASQLDAPVSPEQLDQLYSGFVETWESQLFCTGRRAQLLDCLEDLLWQLETASQPAEVASVRVRLAELWDDSQREASLTRPEGLAEHFLFEALRGHLEGRVPRLVLQHMVYDNEVSPRIQRELLLYLQRGELENLDRLTEFLLQPVEVIPFSLGLVA